MVTRPRNKRHNLSTVLCPDIAEDDSALQRLAMSHLALSHCDDPIRSVGDYLPIALQRLRRRQWSTKLGVYFAVALTWDAGLRRFEVGRFATGLGHCRPISLSPASASAATHVSESAWRLEAFLRSSANRKKEPSRLPHQQYCCRCIHRIVRLGQALWPNPRATTVRRQGSLDASV